MSAVATRPRSSSSNTRSNVSKGSHASGAGKTSSHSGQRSGGNNIRGGLFLDGNEKPQVEKRQIVGQYMLGKTIGEGTFGKVKLAAHMPSGEKVNPIVQ